MKVASTTLLGLLVIAASLPMGMAQSPPEAPELPEVPGAPGVPDVPDAPAPDEVERMAREQVREALCPPPAAEGVDVPVVWTSLNDGAGCGLDADLLDGRDSTFYLCAACKAVDSDRLDGLDSGQLLRRDVGGVVGGPVTVAGSPLRVTGAGGATTIADAEIRMARSASAGQELGSIVFERNGGGGRWVSAITGHVAAHQAGVDFTELSLSTTGWYFTGDGDCTGGTCPHERVRIDSYGRVGIGTSKPAARLHVAGDIRTDGHVFVHGENHVGDAAEPVVGEGLAPGEVVVLDGRDASGKFRVRAADEAYDTEVIGVVSTNPSLRLAGLATDTPLAVTGIVPVKVTGPVARGALLTTSEVPGHAMACLEPAACFGAVLGKAMEAHEAAGPGVVHAMVSLG